MPSFAGVDLRGDGMEVEVFPPEITSPRGDPPPVGRVPVTGDPPPTDPALDLVERIVERVLGELRPPKEPPSQPSTPPRDELWSKVVGRGAGRKAAVEQPSKETAPPSSSSPAVPGGGRRRRKKKKKRKKGPAKGPEESRPAAKADPAPSPEEKGSPGGGQRAEDGGGVTVRRSGGRDHPRGGLAEDEVARDRGIGARLGTFEEGSSWWCSHPGCWRGGPPPGRRNCR